MPPITIAQRRSLGCLLIFLTAGLLLFPGITYAADNIGLILRGVARTVSAAFELPRQVVAGGTQAFPLGLVSGALSGSMRTVAGALIGAVDMARGAAPYAKYAIFAL